MADKCHLCLLGLIILSSLLTGTSGVNVTHVFISSGENVRLPCNNHLHDCKSTTWTYNNNSAAVELINSGIKNKDIERHERLSLGSDCSLNINNIIKEDYGSYICRQYVNDKQQGTDARVYLHVLHVSSSSSQTEISAGSSVTLYCQLFSYTGVSCDDWIRSEGIQLFWVNQAGVKLTISDSRYQISAPGHCIITLTTTLLNEDDNREWRCEVTHRNQVKTSVTYTVKSSGTSGVNDDHVFISSGENVRLPWIKKKNTERHERLSLGSDCSLNIKNIIKEDYGIYTCQQWTDVNGQHQKQANDTHVYLHVLHVSSSSSQTEISAGSSVTLYCQLFSYPGVSCDDWIRSKRIQLFWVNQAGVNLTKSRYQKSASRLCNITLNTTLLNEDDNREWRCEVTHRNQVKTSVTYTVKSSEEKLKALLQTNELQSSVTVIMKKLKLESKEFLYLM
ncbi:Obscurin [Labeo rohita]|uniref:Obscurin n=1 Tax=Labeo rohita TaxID=84645 RepID=A0ABQ8MV96_LABRO|nr:Obscurin [Labeo rohita]